MLQKYTQYKTKINADVYDPKFHVKLWLKKGATDLRKPFSNSLTENLSTDDLKMFNILHLISN